MKHKDPPFEITNTILSDVAAIAELVGKISSVSNLATNLVLRRSNRIRTIHASLAIEQNTLSIEQVTAVLNGKTILAPPKDIAEVKNAYEMASQRILCKRIFQTDKRLAKTVASTDEAG